MSGVTSTATTLRFLQLILDGLPPVSSDSTGAIAFAGVGVWFGQGSEASNEIDAEAQRIGRRSRPEPCSGLQE